MERVRAVRKHLEDRRPRRIGFVGFGKVSEFLVRKVVEDGRGTGMELAFVVDEFDPKRVQQSTLIPEKCKLSSLKDFESMAADLIVEAAHPDISKKWGVRFLQTADYMIASTTTFADPATDANLNAEADRPTGRGIYLTPGALYGAQDIQRMSDSGKLVQLQVTMKKHPDSLYPVENTKEFTLNEMAKGKREEVVLWDGPVRELCGIFPRNVNTIATAAICARKTLGMNKTRAILVADSRLEEMIIEVKACGPSKPDGKPGLRISTLRENPSKRGAVTGKATLNSFYSSLLRVATNPPRGNGVHLA